MSRRQLENAGYLKSFPQSARLRLRPAWNRSGRFSTPRSVQGPAKTGRSATSSTDLVLSPAACYPVYPIAAARGPAPEEGYIFDVAGGLFSARAFARRSIVCSLSACANSCGSVRPSRFSTSARAGSIARPAIAARLAFAAQARNRQRSLLRPRRPADGGDPAGARAEIRAAHPAALGGKAHGLHELQLSQANILARSWARRSAGRARSTRAASPSASIGSRWRCSRTTGLSRTSGATTCAPFWT